MSFSSGIAALDQYLAEGYLTVPGMSSRFAAVIVGHILKRQTEWGIGGDAVEIGTFAGRFYIALAHGLVGSERALGIDTFTWPDEGLLARFHGFVRAHGVPDKRVAVIKGDTAAMSVADIRGKLGAPARLIHIDGEHSPAALTRELGFARAVMHRDGVIVLDDMLHPSFPLLVGTVLDWLRANTDMRVVCVIDREDIAAAAKFVLCHVDAYARYESDLMASFPAQHWIIGAHFAQNLAVVLTPNPHMPDVG